MTKTEFFEFMMQEELVNAYVDDGVPVRVMDVSRLKDNLEALPFLL